MLFSTVLPARGADLPNAIRVLEDQAQRLSNLSGTSAEERLNGYHVWAAEASEQLRHVFDLPQVEALINTQRHDFLLAKSWADKERLVNTAISAEQADRARAFKDVLEGLRGMAVSCNSYPDFLVVPDTNVFLHQEQYFNELDWVRLVNVSANFRIMLPMAVVRELDKGKRAQAGKKVSDTNDQPVRSRARQSAKRLREMFAYPRDVITWGPRVTVELLLDPVGHLHLEDPDTEIIERAAALKAVSSKQVFIMTGDGNMQFMADVAGLDVVALSD
jgi:hypothetical protein